MKKRIGRILIIAIAISIVLFLYTGAGYIPLIGKLIADYKLSKYCNERISTHIGFPYTGYGGYTDSGNSVIYDLNRNLISDSAYSNQINKKCNIKYVAYITNIKEGTVKYPEDIFVSTRINASNSEKTYSMIYILDVLENVELSVDASKERVCELAEGIVKQLDINCTSIQMRYYNRTGYFELVYKSKTEIGDFSKLHEYVKQIIKDNGASNYQEYIGEKEN